MRAALLILLVSACASKLPDDDRAPLRDGATARNIGPLSGARAQSRRPRVRWTTGPDARPVTLEFCRDRACASVIERATREGGAASPDVDLPYGPVFWRVRDPTRAGAGAVSPTWWLTVPHGARGVERAGLSWRTKTTVDADGDGRDDVIDPAGAVRTGPARGATLSRAGTVYDGGDIDGDGFPEVVFAMQGGRSEAGAVYVFRTPLRAADVAPAWTLTGPSSGSCFGAGVAAGDFNGDGYGDLAVGAPGAEEQRGAVYVYPGGSAGLAAAPAYTVEGVVGLGGGFNALAAGDLDGDARDDLLTSAPGSLVDSPSTVVVFSGASLSQSAPLWVERRDVGGSLGNLGLLGDVTGDGVTDAVLAAPGDREAGCLRAYSGAPDAFGRDLGAACAPSARGAQAFRSSIAMGDFDGDGALDVASEVYDTLGNASPMVVMLGGWSRFQDPIPVTRRQAPADLQRADVLASGDLDGDGYAELVSLGFYRGAWGALRYRGAPGWSDREPEGL